MKELAKEKRNKVKVLAKLSEEWKELRNLEFLILESTDISGGY